MLTKQQFIKSILPSTLKYEGGYSNLSNDKGKETYRGISRVYHPTWKGWAFIDKVKQPNYVVLPKTIKQNTIFPELENDVVDFYYEKYFVSNGFNLLNDTNVALNLFDWAVHGGYSVKNLLSILAKHKIVMSEPMLNQKIANAINNLNQSAIAKDILDARQQKLIAIIEKDPTQKQFETGWNFRINNLRSQIKPQTAGIGFGAILLIALAFLGLRRKKND